MDKFVPDVEAALEFVHDGLTIMLGGFGSVGLPNQLLDGLVAKGVRGITLIANNAGAAFGSMVTLLETGAVEKVVCSYPRNAQSTLFVDLYREGKIGLELVPQGTLAERIRAASAGIPAFFTPTAAGTQLGASKEQREINGRLCVLEQALHADVALLEAWQADRWGNLSYRLAGRNFNPIMAGAAKLTIVQTQHKVELGEMRPDEVMTPGIYINRVVHIPYGDPVL
ncbi:MAG: 3-oxoacid CoA-transferase subunit A [Acidocella sp.]|nr:3-oxoacid CoA-transferase subunit A [Acidocella sp.]